MLDDMVRQSKVAVSHERTATETEASKRKHPVNMKEVKFHSMQLIEKALTLAPKSSKNRKYAVATRCNKHEAIIANKAAPYALGSLRHKGYIHKTAS